MWLTFSRKDPCLKLLSAKSRLWKGFFCTRSAGLVCFKCEAAETEAQACTRPRCCCLSQRSHHLNTAWGLTVKILTVSAPYISFHPRLYTESSLMNLNPKNTWSLVIQLLLLSWNHCQRWHHQSETFTICHLATWGQFPLPVDTTCHYVVTCLTRFTELFNFTICRFL